MSADTQELPLFPLGQVLFPGTVLPLHIFEPRYCQMIVDCQQEGKPFGVVLARPESEHLHEIPYSIGTIAEIHNLSQLENGRYNLIAIGTKRFRIASQHREKPYLSGVVVPFEDDDVLTSALDQYEEQARNLFGRYLEILLEAANQKTLETSLPDGAEALSHFIAYLLDIEDEEKQRYLELTSTQQRLQGEIAILRREVPFMRQILLKKIPDKHARLN